MLAENFYTRENKGLRIKMALGLREKRVYRPEELTQSTRNGFEFIKRGLVLNRKIEVSGIQRAKKVWSVAVAAIGSYLMSQPQARELPLSGKITAVSVVAAIALSPLLKNKREERKFSDEVIRCVPIYLKNPNEHRQVVDSVRLGTHKLIVDFDHRLHVVPSRRAPAVFKALLKKALEKLREK